MPKYPERIPTQRLDLGAIKKGSKMQIAIPPICGNRLLAHLLSLRDSAGGTRAACEVDVETAYCRWFAGSAFEDRPRIGIPADDGAHSDQRPLRDSQPVAHCRVDAEEAGFLDNAMARKH